MRRPALCSIAILVLTASVIGHVEANFAQSSSGAQQAPRRRLQTAADAPYGSKCSYADVKAGKCPGKPGYQPFYWDLLFANPSGKESCKPPGRPCRRAQECCPFCGDDNEEGDSSCCSICYQGLCDGPGCFAGDTKVVIKESATPVKIRDLETGQHVQCVDSGEDLTTPGAVKWCPVMNWMHATEQVVPMQQIAFTRANGAPGNVTITFTHFMMRLTSPGVTAGASALRLDDFGTYEVVKAALLDVGDRIILLKDPADASAGYYVAEVTALETVNGNGMYFPMIEMPYIIADGTVVPLAIDWKMPVVAPLTVNGPENLAIMYLGSPVFMTALQPPGVPGTKGAWPDPAGSNKTHPIFPPLDDFADLIRAKKAQGLAFDFMAAQQWFVPRYKAWKADSREAVTWEEMMQAFDQMWVPQPEAAAVEVEAASLSTPGGLLAGACSTAAVTSPSIAAVDAACARVVS